MAEVIIFDLDGTLIDTIADLGAACNHALSQAGFPTHPIEAYPALVGNGVNKLIERSLPENARTEEHVLHLRQYFTPYYDTHCCVYTRPYDGIPELLHALRTKGYRLAVASNKYQAATEQIVNHFFPNTFDSVLGERTDVPRKPHPQIVADTLAATAADRCRLYIGDSDVDMRTAKAAQVPSVACTWGFCTEDTLRAEHPDYLVHSPSNILDLL